MKRHEKEWAMLAVVVGLSLPASAQVLIFEDSFDEGQRLTAWVTKQPAAWVQDGWLHQQDNDGWPRDALIVAHDSDPNWRDYRVRLAVDFVDGTPWEHANLVLRANNFTRSSDGASGTGYQLEFFGNNGWQPADQDMISIIRTDYDTGNYVTLYRGAWDLPSHPFFVDVTLQGGRIALSVDEQPVFDLVDPHPLAAGGIGLHTVWESHTRFDSVYVTSPVPEPQTGALFAAGLLGLLGWRWRGRGGAQ